ncbi:MAG: PAS domain S-box protein, partial [Methanoregula sp.]|nr:PAS domain S-box protein [Methanoregula sp.]
GMYYISERSYDIFGLSSDTATFFSRFTGCVAPEDREAFISSIDTAIKTVGKWNFRGRYIKPTGEEMYFHGLSEPLVSGDERVFYGMLLDITAQERAERALLASESRYHSLFENAMDAIFIMDHDTIIDCNPASLQLFRCTRNQILGHTPYDFSPAQQTDDKTSRQFALERISTAINGKPQYFPWVHQTADGKPFTADVTLNKFEQVGKTGLMATIRDTSERTKVLNDLRRSEEHYRSLIETTGTGYVILDRDGRVITANPEYLRLTGRSALAEILGKLVTDWTAPYDLKRNAQEVEQCFLTGRVRNLEIDFQKPDGTIQPVEVNASIIESGSGEIILTLCRDISERRQAERALKTEQDFTRLLLETSPAFVVAIGSDGRTISMNRALIDALEYTKEEIRGADYLTTFVPEEDRPMLATVFREIVFDGKVTVNENRIISKSGKVFLVEWHGRTVKHEDQKPDFFVGVGIDITGRKKTEEELRESEEKYRAIIENIEDMFYRTDNAGTLLMVSLSAARFAGFTSPEEMIGINIRTLYLNPSDRDIFLAELKKTGSVTSYLLPFRKHDGTIRAVTESSHYYYDNSGVLKGVEGILHDVTELQEAGKSLAEANRKLNLLNSITRHDMLNQLVALKGYIGLAQNQPESAGVGRYLDKCGMVAEILERQISFTRDYQDMGVKAPVWQNVREMVKKNAATIPAGEVRITDDCTDAEVYADPLFEKVFYNLIDNALRYGGERLTTIRFSCHESDKGLSIACEDDGNGISADDKIHLFEQGFGKNTGLGLFLSREILAITGISIQETGKQGNGACFEIRVPKGAYRFTGRTGSRGSGT